jgi:hypothetical protein
MDRKRIPPAIDDMFEEDIGNEGSAEEVYPSSKQIITSELLVSSPKT